MFLTKNYICGSSDHVLRVWYGHSWKITKLSTLNASLRLHDLCPHIECFLLVNHLHKNCVLSYAVWKTPQKKATKTCSTMWTPQHKWTAYKSDMAQCTKTKYNSGISHMASWRVQYSLSNLTFHLVTKKKKMISQRQMCKLIQHKVACLKYLIFTLYLNPSSFLSAGCLCLSTLCLPW